MSVAVERLAGAYVAWELHIGSHYCPAATSDGFCAVGDELLRRLHTAYFSLSEDDRSDVLGAVRAWDWEPEAPYPREENA